MYTKGDKMKRGFTLLELIVVIIIVGILATLALTQYGRTIERSRSTEARAILGAQRKDAAAFFMANGTLTGIVNADVGIGTMSDQAPSAPCRTSHYFSYAQAMAASPTITFTATRCTAGGKTPNNPIAGLTVILTSNIATGVDAWGGTAYQ